MFLSEFSGGVMYFLMVKKPAAVLLILLFANAFFCGISNAENASASMNNGGCLASSFENMNKFWKSLTPCLESGGAINAKDVEKSLGWKFRMSNLGGGVDIYQYDALDGKYSIRLEEDELGSNFVNRFDYIRDQSGVWLRTRYVIDYSSIN